MKMCHFKGEFDERLSKSFVSKIKSTDNEVIIEPDA